MAARQSTYNALQRARTIIYYLFHDQVCRHCRRPFTKEDIKKFRLTMDHKNGKRRDNSRKNQRWMHPPCHKSMTMRQRAGEIHRYKRLVRKGLRIPGKNKMVGRATPFGG